MNHRATTLTVALAALALPASSLAASSDGTVLSVDQSRHLVQVVDAGHLVHAYHFGHIGRVSVGSRIRFKASHQSISAVRNLGESSTLSFYAKVVRSRAAALVLRLADGEEVNLGAKQLSRAHAAVRTNDHSRPIGIDIGGLQPGDTVLVTEPSDGHGNPTITIDLTATSSGGSVTERQVSGVVFVGVKPNTFAVTTAAGSALSLHMSQDALAKLNMSVCDTVTIFYHRDAGMLIADNVRVGRMSMRGACAPGTGPAGPGSSGPGRPVPHGPQDAVGAITTVSGKSIAINRGAGQGTLTFKVDDPSITSGFSPGDVIDVTYTQLVSGTFDASSVQYVETDAIGVATAVSDGSITLTGQSSGNPITLTDDPTNGTFAIVSIGDHVDVAFHITAGGAVVDRVLDTTPSATPQYASGLVTAVSLSSVTFTDDSTGKPDTYAVDPITGLLAGVNVGDAVDVTFHIGPGGVAIVDSLLDTPPITF